MLVIGMSRGIIASEIGSARIAKIKPAGEKTAIQ